MTATAHLSHELARLREQHEAARLTLEIRQLQAAAGVPLTENWGDIVDRREPWIDDPGFSSGPFGSYSAFEDRRDGQFRPVYQTEQDLARIRGAARHLSTITAVSGGALDALANYVLAGGFAFTARSDYEQPRLVTAVQRVIDEFLDANDFAGGLDRELHQRSREDGEAFVALVPRSDGAIRAQVLEPDQIAEPADARALDEWLGQPPSAASWSFGVHTLRGEPDVPLGYHVLHDPAGREWDYIPAARLQHIKRNVPRNAKRGVSDLYAIQGDLEREAKLRRNTAAGAALQAAIAWILQAAPGTTPAQARGIGGADQFVSYRKPVEHGYKLQGVRNYAGGTILVPSAGLEYRPGPMGAERNPHFVLAAQYVLRAIGVRWNMPEYLISGDASNANYASALVAESPFVKAREADQQFYRRHWHELVWKMLRQAWLSGRFARLGIAWETLEQLIEVKVDVPAVATRDPLALARTQELQIRLGLLSRRTAATQAGLDYDAETRMGAGVPKDKSQNSNV